MRVPPISPACPQPLLELWALGAGADQEQVDGPSAGGEEAEGGSAGHYMSSWPALVQSVARRGARGEDEEEGGGDGGVLVYQVQTFWRGPWHQESPVVSGIKEVQ